MFSQRNNPYCELLRIVTTNIAYKNIKLNNMKKILGLDLGTNSIGWALVNTDEKGKPCSIAGMGSRIIPMGTDKQDYEKGVGITKNATRREKRIARKGNKRFKLRRNKLLFILNELGMLPEQFQFKNGIPEPTKLQDLELLPVSKRTKQLDALGLLELKVRALEKPVSLNEFGKIFYQFNQLRGYSGGNNDDSNKKKKDEDEDAEKKKYEVVVQKVEILKVEQSDNTFTVRGGKNKGEKQFYFDITIIIDGEEVEGQTELQNIKEKEGHEEELEIRITRKKDDEVTYKFALPQKSNWRKAMELSEKTLKEENLFISQLRLRDLQQNKWVKIRNRVFLRNRYKDEFDKVWETQTEQHPILRDCPKETLGKIVNYIFPGNSESQQSLRKTALEKGLKYIIKEQVIYYQRPLKPQTELIGNCRFEKEEKVIPISHPFFQEFRCWKQINNLFVTSKTLVGNKYTYQNRYLTSEEKRAIYEKLQTQKEVGFATVVEILNIDKSKGKLDKEQKDYFLNGLNVKAKLKGCDTFLSFKKELGEDFNDFISQDKQLVGQLWTVIFDVRNHDGSEYDVVSKRVSSIIAVLRNYTDEGTAKELSLELAQKIKFPRKYASLSEKAIRNILPLMLPNPQFIPETIQQQFKNIQYLIETGEILDNAKYKLEDYVIDFVKSNPNVLQDGGIMESFAISLVYGKHTAETIKPYIKNYHNIKFEERNLRNPVVEQLANETMQVIKAIWKQYKFNPEELEIRVELARDLKNSAAEREKIWNGQRKSKTINDKAKERLQEDGIPITDENILKYRLYQQQKFMSPYTKKKIIPFSKLFDDKEYDIDHIIPKSRYYDDSFSNKVICEKYINEEKSNRTAWEYISQQNSKCKNEKGELEIVSTNDFLNHVNENYFGKKKKNLLAEKIPSNPIERQLKDTQYISVAIKSELAKIVGSDNIKTSTGEVTDFLRSRWGLRKLFMELTESRFKQMELWDLDEDGNPKTKWVTRTVIDDGEKKKNFYEIKNWSKRYDHRHHSIDALVVALTTQSHIHRLNNLNKYYQDELTARKDEFKIEVKEGESILEGFFNLEAKRRDEILRQIESSRYFEMPFDNLVEQVRGQLETMVVSHKPKDKLGIKTDDFDKNTPNKILKKQIKVRAGIHQETYYGSLNGRDTKRVDISSLSLSDVSKIVIDNVLANEIIEHKKQYNSMKEAFTGEGLKAFNDKRNVCGIQPAYKVKVWYNKEEKKESGLQRLYENNDKQSVITGDNYLFLVMEKNGKRIFDIASLYDSVSIATDALKADANDFKKKIIDDYRIKHKDKPEKVLFTLQQNELVYLPNNIEEREFLLGMSVNEFRDWIKIKANKKAFSNRVYKVVKFTGSDCKFIPHNYSNIISVLKEFNKEQKDQLKKKYEEKKSIPKNELNFVEFGSYRDCSPYEAGEIFVKSLVNKKQKQKPLKIQDSCIKIKIDWLGNISI
jgi:CRISPR/Cas system Type II protein with McrA/HNH and RuvC-like nuclease domain